MGLTQRPCACLCCCWRRELLPRGKVEEEAAAAAVEVAVLVDHLPDEVWTGGLIILPANPVVAPTTAVTMLRRSRTGDPMRARSVHVARVQTCAAPTTIFATIRDCQELCTRTRTICVPAIKQRWLIIRI